MSEEFRVQFTGPFQRHDVVVTGWQVPFLHAQLAGDEQERVMLVLDDRLGFSCSIQEAERFVPFLAHAIAIGLGFGAHPNEEMEPPLDRLFDRPSPRRVQKIIGSEEAA
jgi:hypothetical protein